MPARSRRRGPIPFFRSHPRFAEELRELAAGSTPSPASLEHAIAADEREARDLGADPVAVYTQGAGGALTLRKRCNAAEAERYAAELRAQGHHVQIVDPRMPSRRRMRPA